MKVLVAVDTAEQSDAPVEMLKSLKLEDGSKIRIVSVVDRIIPVVTDIYDGPLMDETALEKTATDRATRALKEIGEGVEGSFTTENVTVSTEVLFGSPDRCIVEAAEQMDSDLIIVGSHGYKAWERLLIGSVSDSVVHHAPCSVMVVRTKPDKPGSDL